MAVAIHRMGSNDLRLFAVDSGTVIARGDMLFLDTDDVKPASSFTWDTNIATTQTAFAVKFAGVAAEAHAAGVAGVISVDVSPLSVWEMDQASATAEVGGPLAPAKQSGNALENQKLVAAAASASIGRVHTRLASANTRVLATLASAYAVSANNDNGPVG